MDTEVSVEYLFISSLADSFCIDDTGFKSVLRSISGLEVKGNSIKYKNNSYRLDVVHGKAESEKSVYFNITITSSSENVSEFAELLRLVRTIINKFTQNPPQVLWDGLGLYYSQQAYPKIYRTENLLRKLITKFMIINAGLGWHSQSVPKEVEQSIKNKSNNDYLHNVDFIQLSVFLFKEYEGVNTKPIIEKISKAKTVSELDIDELKNLSPLSNWDRYFAPLIPCDAEFLRNRWKQLYDFRNSIAHSRSITKTDLDKIESIISDIEPKLVEAISKLNEVFVPNEQRAEVLDSAVANLDTVVGTYLRKFNEINESLIELFQFSDAAESEKERVRRMPFRALLDHLTGYKIINIRMARRLAVYSAFRNELVHKAHPTIEIREINSLIEDMESEASEIIFRLLTLQHDNQDPDASNSTLEEEELPDLPF